MADSAVSGATKVKVALAWLFVGIPLAWGVLSTLTAAMALFR